MLFCFSYGIRNGDEVTFIKRSSRSDIRQINRLKCRRLNNKSTIKRMREDHSTNVIKTWMSRLWCKLTCYHCLRWLFCCGYDCFITTIHMMCVWVCVYSYTENVSLRLVLWNIFWKKRLAFQYSLGVLLCWPVVKQLN